MPVYNGAEFLGSAIESILWQTEKDFELLIIDDGSTDTSREIVASYSTDPRIKALNNDRNSGVVATLNRGLKIARGTYIARMDADDISFPERLQKQADYLDQNPDTGLVGCAIERQRGNIKKTFQPPTDDRHIRFSLLFDSVFTHSAVMLRRSLLEAQQLSYHKDYIHAEDYQLWIQLSRYCKLANLAETLLTYREHAASVSHKFRSEQIHTADRIRKEYLAHFGLMPTPQELALHQDLIQFRLLSGTEQLKAAGDWLKKLAKTISQQLELPEPYIHRKLARYWYGASGQIADEGLKTWWLFMACPMGKNADLSWQAKLFARCILGSKIKATSSDSAA